ncbi:MAG: sulfotransferase family protein [Anaerolineae bacterium]
MNNSNTSPKPSFFVVGAPRCGTTAICQFLNQHPDIFIPYFKEPHYFGSDLSETRRGFKTSEDYLELFEEANHEICGEGSTWYLFSEKAAQEIKDFNPDAKIVISVRNPVEMLYSWHGFALQMGTEDIEDFEEALEAESDRRQGKRIPIGSAVEKLYYSEIPLYTKQIERYQKLFSKEQIHIIIFDDFKTDQAKVLRDLYEFLGVDPTFEPDVQTVNSHGVPRSKLVARLINHQPEFVRKYANAWVPRKLRAQIKHMLRGLNKKQEERPSMSIKVKNQLKQVFKAEVSSLSTLLDRDLSHWVDSEPIESAQIS